MARNRWNGWKWLEMSRNGQKWLEMAIHGWKGCHGMEETGGKLLCNMFISHIISVSDLGELKS